MSSLKACIFILTQNTPERKIYLKTTLYFLFQNFNSKYKYPLRILHEGDYDATSQEEIIKSVRSSMRHLVTFKELDKTDFDIPEHINLEKVNKSIEIQPVPYWRNLKYRSMCYFWIKHFFKYTKEFDYVMRLDDDSFIEEPIAEDFFKILEHKNLVYISNIVHVDCGLCNFQMKELFERIAPDKKEMLNGIFVSSVLGPDNPIFHKFKKVHSLITDKEIIQNEYKLDMPYMYYNNFFITRTAFWNQEDVKKIIEEIDKDGGIFYYRYGDAPLQTLILSILAPSQISKAKFKYSKRLQREVFIDQDKNFHSYMPNTYNKSSCMLEEA